MLINNAGVAEWSDLEDVTEDAMLRCFQTNTLGPLFTTQQLVKVGLLRRGSLVAQMTSKMGSIGELWVEGRLFVGGTRRRGRAAV